MYAVALTKALPALRIALQVGALWLLSWIAQGIAALSPLPLPGGAVGLVLLFTLLCTGAVRARWIERGADVLVRHLGLFLVPYAVSFMARGELVSTGGALVLVIVASTAIGIASAGAAAQAGARAVHRSALGSPQR
jgi:holin-like protein